MGSRKITQGDIFDFLTRNEKIPFLKQSKLVEILENKLGVTNIHNHMSDIKNGTRNGLDLTYLTVDDIYDAIFDQKFEPKSEQAALEYYKNAVREKGVTFEGWEGKEGDTLESYMKRMFENGIFVKDRTTNKKNTGKPSPRPKGIANLFSDPNFIGREDILKDVEERLKNSSVAVLLGLGGIGKTTISNEYAKNHKNEYDCIIKLNFNDSRNFESAVANISFVALDDKWWSEKQRLNYKLEYLNNAEKILIILDNVDNEKLDLRLFLDFCEKSKCHKIVTTRLKKQFEGFQPISVNALDKEQQRKLFKNNLVISIDEDDEQYLDEILKRINGHTKMIMIVSSLMNKRLLTCEGALDYLNNTQCDNDNFIYEQLSKIYNTQLLNSDEKRTLLTLMLLPEEGISMGFLSNILQKELKSTVSPLYETSWLEIEDKKRVHLHPIIRETLINEEKLVYEDQMALFTRLYDVLKNEKAKRKYEDELCNTANSIIKNIDFSKALNDRLLSQMLEMSDFCFDHYKFQQANEICSSAIKHCKNNSEDISSACMYDLYRKAGKTYQRLADYESASSCFLKAIEYVEQTGGTELGKCYRDLGEVYRKDAKYKEALENDEKAIEYLTDPLDIAEAKNAIGVVYINLADNSSDPKEKANNYKKAHEFYKEALTLREENNAEAKAIAYSYHNIGSYFNKIGDYSEAVKYHKKALEIREKNDIDKADIAASFAWLGNDYIALDDMDNAKDYIDKSLALRESLYGKAHPDYAWGLSSLVDWYYTKGMIEEAKNTNEEVIKIRKTFLGENHDYTKRAIQRQRKMVAEPTR